MEDSTPFVPPFRAARTESCLFEGCDDQAQSRNLCWGHYKQWVSTGTLSVKRTHRVPRPCGFDGCDRRHSRNGWCGTHSLQALQSEYMTPIGARRKKYVIEASSGYVKVWSAGHPNAQGSGYVLQHVLVMSALMGRGLEPHETVHHKNGDRSDNRPENLELWSHSQPKGQRVADKVAWAIELLQTYEPDSLS